MEIFLRRPDKDERVAGERLWSGACCALMNWRSHTCNIRCGAGDGENWRIENHVGEQKTADRPERAVSIKRPANLPRLSRT